MEPIEWSAEAVPFLKTLSCDLCRIIQWTKKSSISKFKNSMILISLDVVSLLL